MILEGVREQPLNGRVLCCPNEQWCSNQCCETSEECLLSNQEVESGGITVRYKQGLCCKKGTGGHYEEDGHREAFCCPSGQFCADDKNGICCKSGEQLCDEKCCTLCNTEGTDCCETARICGTNCCGSEQTCDGGVCKCKQNEIKCGENCCGSGQKCEDGECQCGEDEEVCGKGCCGQEQECNKEGECECAEGEKCGTKCCPNGQECENGVCSCSSDEATKCGEKCCENGCNSKNTGCKCEEGTTECVNGENVTCCGEEQTCGENGECEYKGGKTKCGEKCCKDEETCVNNDVCFTGCDDVCASKLEKGCKENFGYTKCELVGENYFEGGGCYACHCMVDIRDNDGGCIQCGAVFSVNLSGCSDEK